MLLVRPEFVPPGDCAELVTAVERIASTASALGGVRIMPDRTEIAGEVFRQTGMIGLDRWLTQVRQRVLDAVRRFYEVEGPLFVEFTLVTEMRVGDAHPLHADNEQQDVDGEWIPNHTSWRDYTAMLYLNTGGVDYEGGLLRFPRLEQEIVPRAGQLVGFTCGHEHQHEVSPIQRGHRYSVSMWLTRDPSWAEEWD